jgi:hypothetical protein
MEEATGGGASDHLLQTVMRSVDARHTRFDVPTQLAISLIENPRMGESVNDLTGRGGGAQPKARVVKIFRCSTAAFRM